MFAIGNSSKRYAAAGTERALLEALATPETYGIAQPVEVHETHASWVFVAGEFAYKVKKPVALGFLDYSSLERRLAACLEEVRVNQELAPGIYLGVRAIVTRPGGYRLAPAEAPDACEYAVQMRKFDESDTLAASIAGNKLEPIQIERVARRLASFHRAAPAAAGWTPERVNVVWCKNLRELDELHPPQTWNVALARRFGASFVSAHAAEIKRRERAGQVRDGHGDLRCEHILLRPTVRVVDRIEFDRALRCTDVAADLAFLLMDLEAWGRPDAADLLARVYVEAGGSLGGEALLAFYCAHRAFVRAKVSLLPAGRELPDRAHRLWTLGELMCWRARRPLALIVCGPPASGKSTLAGELARRSGMPIVSSDLVRKELAGIPAERRAGPEQYTAAFTEQTYDLLGLRACDELRRRGGVIVDATCRDRRQRAALLDRLGAAPDGCMFICCNVAPATALKRARRRMQLPGRVSDATPDIVARQRPLFQPLDELPADAVYTLDAEAAIERQVAEVAGAVDRRTPARDPQGA